MLNVVFRDQFKKNIFVRLETFMTKSFLSMLLVLLAYYAEQGL